MKEKLRIYALGVTTGMGIAIAIAAGAGISRAADTPSAPTQKVDNKGPVGFQIQTGVVSDGEHVPVPSEADTGAVHVFLSVRGIQDNNEILGRVECFLEADGRTARVRNVNKFTGEVVAPGTANYVVFFQQ